VKREGFENLEDFLGLYYDACGVLLHEVDFYELCLAYLDQAIAENVVVTEIFFDP
jgi:adenosine deaminase